ncbi:MAG: sodium-translocating pyrophosphatase [Candidatus Lokiarchaeota archaeon]|nr:sodium-translocating pyrophosphatase [Candidatus Lokiarchaeota archaeon]
MLHILPAIEKFKEILSNFAEHPVFFICIFILIPLALIFSLVSIFLIYRKINALEKKTVRMREISADIKHGAKVYLKDQAKSLLKILVLLFIPVGITGFNFLDNPLIGILLTGLIFLLGSVSSLIAGYIGMIAATKSNILVVEASIDDPNKGFKLSYYGGMITGILNISMFVLGIWLVLILTNGNIYLMVGYDFGASVSALFAQVGGGIYTKSADMGADLVGKYEMDIKEDDPRNPAIIADLVGDNVGDCAGRGADLFESAASDAIGGMVLGLAIFLLIGEPIFIISNLTLIALGLFSLFFTTIFLKIDFKKPAKSIWRVFLACTLFNILIIIIINILFFGILGFWLIFSSIIGLVSVFITIIFTTYYTRSEYTPTKKVAVASQISPSSNIIAGLSTGFSSVFGPMIIFALSVVGSYLFGYFCGIHYVDMLGGYPTNNILGEPIDGAFLLPLVFGIWGVNMASVSSDIIISTVLSFDTFGPIADNAAGIAEMGHEEASEGLRDNLDKLDAIGNTTKAIAKGFALICGGFSSIVLFFTFLLSANTLAEGSWNIFNNLNLENPLIIMGLSIGTVISILFTAMVFKAVQKGSMKMVLEVRHQFKNIPGLKEGANKPDYDECINICAKNALNSMLKPVLYIIAIELILGILFGPIVISAFLIGNLIGCLIMGFWQSIGGASFDNAKKSIEAGLFGGKGSFAHKSAIIGDTVGDPLKDAAGPSMNILITTINNLALTFLPIFILTGYLWNIIPF